MYQLIFGSTVGFWLLIGLGLISTLNSTIYYTYFWQLKEYRWDRMKDFLSTASGFQKIFRLVSILKLIALATFLSLLISPKLIFNPIGEAIVMLAIFVVILDCVDLGLRFFGKKIYRPAWTIKSMLITILTLIASISFLPLMMGSFSPPDWIKPLIALGAAVASPLVNALIVALFYPFTQFGKAKKLKAANRKIAQMQGLKVIGITGSYGKSSVKEFLSQMLEKKFNVLKTPGNTNTEIGVAEVVLKNLKPEHQVFIVEAGAYKIGEIKKIAEMVKPRIGIITAVKDAHLGLFGSLENIKKAKFELIESLPEFGVAIFNNDNAGSAELAERAKNKVIRYGKSDGSDLRAEKLEADVDGVSFEVKGVKFFAPLPGLQNVSNILGAMAAALELGMKLEDLVDTVAGLKTRDHTLTVKKISADLVLVDDTYNANPDGVIAGLDYLSLFKDWQKIVVFPGMLELGERTDAEHQRVANKMSEVCDFVVLTSHDFDKSLMAGFEEKNYTNYSHYIENQAGIIDLLKEKTTGKKTVILFVSRGSETVIKKISQWA